jgi:hypothetical protein
MPEIDPAFMTFFFTDGTKEIVNAHTFNTGLAKCTNPDPIGNYHSWTMGKDPYNGTWDAENNTWVFDSQY